MFQEKLIVGSNERVTGEYYTLKLDVGPKVEETQIGRDAKPGQFVQLRVYNGAAPLLRRPFTFYKARRRFIEILYRVVGEGTRFLTTHQKGDELDVIGPLGKGFELVQDVDEHVLVAGGSGLASMYLLSRMCGRSPAKSVLLFGARTKDEIPFKKDIGDDFDRLGIPTQVWTDDGSLGNTGFVTRGLEKILGEADKMKFAVYASGPVEMIREVAVLTGSLSIPTQVSLEQQLSCGIGACQGCAVKTSDEGGSGYVYRKVCTDGPVFNPAVLEGYWDEIAAPQKS
ncbi:MAG: dihydroorotate dehydrogenase electron transfer subunit [Planctomycetota bacterium]|jgi:dihydroorotate dehydrogenase electron transfer subunit